MAHLVPNRRRIREQHIDFATRSVQLTPGAATSTRRLPNAMSVDDRSSAW